MKEAVTMWKYTKMIVLTALTAALYAGTTIPFKPLTIIPGLTEVRPGVVVPVVFGVLFGPAGAWGAAFGNLIGDFYGTLGIGSLFGFIGNFFAAMAAYKFGGTLLWPKTGPPARLPRRPPRPSGQARVQAPGRAGQPTDPSDYARFLLIAVITSMTCGVTIGWGTELLNLVPFVALGMVIILNNTIAVAILGPPLFLLLRPRVERWGLFWTEIMTEEDVGRPISPLLGRILIVGGALGAVVAGVFTSSVVYGVPIFRAQLAQLPGEVWLLMAPFVAALIVGMALA